MVIYSMSCNKATMSRKVREMPKLDKFLNGIMMSGENQEALMSTYEGLKDLVIADRDREIRFIDAGAYPHTANPFEKIMEIQEECKRRLDFLDMAMLLSGSYQSEGDANLKEQEMAKAS